jgi:hypothetical protein
MTIIASVYLKEGIIMSADSRITGVTTYPNGMKDRHTLSDSGQKLFLIKNESVGISCCGDQEIDGKTVPDFIRVFEQSIVDDADSVKVVAEKLHQFVSNKYNGTVEFHVCGYMNGKKQVYRIINNAIHEEVTDANADECGVVWSGEPKVISNLLTGSNAIPIEWNFMQLKDGIDFAEFLVDVTCKIHRFQSGIGTCGGSIDILLLTKDYSKWIRHKVLNP